MEREESRHLMFTQLLSAFLLHFTVEVLTLRAYVWPETLCRPSLRAEKNRHSIDRQLTAGCIGGSTQPSRCFAK